MRQGHWGEGRDSDKSWSVTAKMLWADVKLAKVSSALVQSCGSTPADRGKALYSRSSRSQEGKSILAEQSLKKCQDLAQGDQNIGGRGLSVCKGSNQAAGESTKRV